MAEVNSDLTALTRIYDMPTFANSVLAAVAAVPTGRDTAFPSPAAQPSHAPISATVIGTSPSPTVSPREVPIHPQPVEWSVLDWVADWCQTRYGLTRHDARLLVMAAKAHEQDGGEMSRTEWAVLACWRKVASELGAESEAAS